MGFPEWMGEGRLGDVPVRWCETDGPVSAGLVFRVGRVDERLATAGITHLVEHLAAEAAGASKLQANAYVGLQHTGFHVRGTRAEVDGFLDATCRALASLPLDRLETETKVLDAELATVPRGPVAPLFTLRYGFAGAGLVSSDELGLRRLGAEEVAAWARERFTSGNAALWMTADPGGRPLPLPPGPRMPAPPAIPIPGLELPAWTDGAPDTVCVTFLGHGRAACSAAVSILRERILDDLRRRLGLVYEVDGDATDIGADVHATLVVPCPREHSETVCNAVLDALERLANEPPTEGEVAETLRRWRRAHDDPANRPGLLHDAALAALGARPVEPPWGITPSDVSAAMGRLGSSLLVAVPDRIRVGRSISRYATPSTPPVTGERIRRQLVLGPLRVPLRAGAGAVVLGEEGLTLDLPGSPSTIRFEDCEAAVMGPGGSVRLVARDTRWINLVPSRFFHGERMVQRVLDRIGADRVVPATREEQRLERASERLGRHRILPAALHTVAGALAPGEEAVLVARLRSSGTDGAAIFTDRRAFVVHWRARSVRSLVELEYQDVDAVSRLAIGDGVRVDMAGRKGTLTAASHAEAALIEQSLRDGMARARTAGLPRGSDEERRAVARSFGKYKGDMGLGAIVVPVTIGLSSGIGADVLPGVGTLLGGASAAAVVALLAYRARHRFGGWRGAVLTWRTSAPVLGATVIVAAGRALVGG